MPHFLVSVCKGSECVARGSDALHAEAVACVKEQRLGDHVTVTRGGCWGLCNLGPNVVVRQDEAARAVEGALFGHDATFLGKVGEFHYGACAVETVQRIVREHLAEGHPIPELASDRALRATAKKLSKD